MFTFVYFNSPSGLRIKWLWVFWHSWNLLLKLPMKLWSLPQSSTNPNERNLVGLSGHNSQSRLNAASHILKSYLKIWFNLLLKITLCCLSAIFCDALALKPHSSVNPESCVNGSKPGEVCSYSCDSGFDLIGPANRTCSPRGSWDYDDQAPTCKGKNYRHSIDFFLLIYLLKWSCNTQEKNIWPLDGHGEYFGPFCDINMLVAFNDLLTQ